MIIATSEFDKEINLIIANAIREDVGTSTNIFTDSIGYYKIYFFIEF